MKTILETILTKIKDAGHNGPEVAEVENLLNAEREKESKIRLAAEAAGSLRLALIQAYAVSGGAEEILLKAMLKQAFDMEETLKALAPKKE